MKRNKFLSILIMFGFTQMASAEMDVTGHPAFEEKTQSQPGLLDKVVIDLEQDTFDRSFSNWVQGYISYGHQFSFGSVIARYNRAKRFDVEGEQIEVDAYPHLREGTYAYLNYGYSRSSIFPENRYGGEVFQSLPESYEASLGFRRLQFSSGNVTLWTGSLAKYFGNYYVFFRPYHTPSDIGVSNSWTLGLRYYRDDVQYIALSLGEGLSVQQDSNLKVIGLKSQKISVDANISVGDYLFLHPGVGCSREEIRPDVFRKMWAYDLSLEKRF